MKRLPETKGWKLIIIPHHEREVMFMLVITAGWNHIFTTWIPCEVRKWFLNGVDLLVTNPLVSGCIQIIRPPNNPCIKEKNMDFHQTMPFFWVVNQQKPQFRATKLNSSWMGTADPNRWPGGSRRKGKRPWRGGWWNSWHGQPGKFVGNRFKFYDPSKIPTIRYLKVIRYPTSAP